MSKQIHVLICDDQPIIHETLGAYLENEGYSYSSAFDGEKAVSMAAAAHPIHLYMFFFILLRD